MGQGLLKTVCAPLLAVLLGGTILSRSTVADDGSSGSLEVKHVGPDNRVSTQSFPAKAAHVANRLVAFPEDAQEEPAPSKGRQPAAQRPNSKSTFQPRFKTPVVRKVEHTEPVTDESVSEAQTQGESVSAADESGPALGSTPQALPMPSTSPQDAVADGRPLVDQAFAKSKTAKSDSDFTEVIDLCGRGRKAGIKQNYDDYARRLMGWSYNRRGELRAESGRDTEALADFEMAVESSPNSWRAIHNRGVSYAALGRLDEAMSDFERTIELNASYPNAYFNRAELRYRRGDYQGAVDDYTTALKVGKPDPMVLNSRGHAFYRLERFGEALRDYSGAIHLDPENAAALINRGDTYADLGQYGEAANDYRAAIKADPKLARAYQSAAWLMATCPDAHYRNEKMAVDAARKALSLGGGSDYRDLETLAAAQANAGGFAEARQTQESAIGKAPAGHRVGAEKRLALYQHDRPFREMPRTAFEPAENEPEHPVRRASATAPVQPAQSQPQRRRPYRGANRQ